MPITTYVGDTGTPFKFPLTLVDGTKPNLTGFTNANFQLHLWNGTTTKICSGGTWSIVDGPNGICQYQPVSADLDTAGQWTVYLSVIFPNGPKTFQPDTITVTATH